MDCAAIGGALDCGGSAAAFGSMGFADSESAADGGALQSGVVAAASKTYRAKRTRPRADGRPWLPEIIARPLCGGARPEMDIGNGYNVHWLKP